jgi:DEAD/DEAH box helicase domain-containing protein
MARREGLAAILHALGYEVVTWEEPPEEPEQTDTSFEDVAPELRGHEKARLRLYRHQVETIRALEEGNNVILTARTGSGKTEAWALAALRNRWRVIAVYPTLALAADQIRRLEDYYSHAGLEGAVVRVDRPTLTGRKSESILKSISKAYIVVTNPAFLLAEIKRMALHPHRALLEDFLSKVDLIVVDELDFYGPRGAHLILAMLDIISNYLAARKPRVVVLSATLGNPEELARELSRVTGRKTVIVEGKPFKLRNRVVLVLGKGADALRRYIQSYSSVIASRAPWILSLLEDEEEFREHLYEVYEALEAIGLRPPRPGMDPVEILQAIVESSKPGELTLAFTRSIRMAERVYRSLVERLPEDKRGLVAVHHHLVSKRAREQIEAKARSGQLALIVTVRTLAQGIDIGHVRRVVHIGLPADLREYMQREGRKGRRRELGYSETVIIPSGLWDRKLLEAGSSALKQWVQLHLEKLYVNPSNAYAAIFKAMWKLLRGLELEEWEVRLLRKFRLVEEYTSLHGTRLTLSDRGKAFWNDIGFYEHGPPYGYRKIVRQHGREVVLRGEEVSLRDAVEKYQPGSFDPMTEALVVSVDPRKYRVYEEPVEEAVESYDWLARAAARYEDIKRAWGEYPRLADDMKYGRITTAVALNVVAPTGGFGELVEEPVEVEWIVESAKPRLSRGSGGVRVYHEVAVVELNAPVAGRYRDYTYGYVFEAPGNISAEDLRLGLAALIVFLRLDPEVALPLGLLRYRVASAGPVKLVHLWEREAAGVLETLDWLRIAERLERAETPGIIVPLIAAVDPESAIRIMRGEVPLEAVRRLAALAARLIAGGARVQVGGVVVEYPEPSRRHGIAAVAALYETLQSDGGTNAVAAVAVYDGERVEASSYRGALSLDTHAQIAQMVLSKLDRLASEGFTIYYYGREQRDMLIRMLAGSYFGPRFLRAVEEEGRLRDGAELVAAKADGAPILMNLEPKLRSYLDWLNKARTRRDVDEVENAAKSLVEAMARAIYKAVLAALKGRIEVSSR